MSINGIGFSFELAVSLFGITTPRGNYATATNVRQHNRPATAAGIVIFGKIQRMATCSRRQFIGATAATALLPGVLQAALTSSKRPNVIFILADDLGLDGVSCYGANDFKTPNIDALARGGMRFEYCFSAPLCGPSRAMLMTGRYPFRTGMTSNNTGANLKPHNETMLPLPLRAAGYKSCQVGKWHQLPLQPGDWGFDEYFRFQNGGVYWGDQAPGQHAKGRRQNGRYVVNGQAHSFPPDAYVPDMMHDFLIDFITRHQTTPFFAYYSLSHVHAPILRTPDSTPVSNLYADNIAYMDKLVGRLMAELDRLQLRENTLVIFAGDNGTARLDRNPASVNGQVILGQKHSMHEGGSRVPLIAHWPAQIAAGQVCQDLTDFSDFFPTLIEVSGAANPTGVTIDGHSFAPQLGGTKGTPREWVYVELDGKKYVRNANWKLNNDGELFDMRNAPFEEALVSKENASAEAVAARATLQKVLNNLSTAEQFPATP
jgi:arylsulfatase A